MALHKFSALALSLVVAAPVAQAAVVDLDALSLANSTSIQSALPGYGSEGPVTLDWDPTGDSGRRLVFWNGAYSGQNAVYCGGTDCTLDMTVAATHTVTLGSFRLGGWPDTDRSVSWSVIDLADSSVVASAIGAFVSGATGLTVSLGVTSTTGFRILFGPDGFNGGLTDIAYSYTPTSQVPLPAAGWLVVAGVGALAALRRRKVG
jgi:hypothetical protein